MMTMMTIRTALIIHTPTDLILLIISVMYNNSVNAAVCRRSSMV